jgi:hypothetical protein
MNAPLIARILGALFLVAGVLALIPVPFLAGTPPFDAPVVTLDLANRMLFGIFPVNLAHDVLHIVLGVWGLLAGARFAWAVGYCRVTAVLYLLLVLFGAIPLTNTLLGVAPIYGYDLLLHLVAALLAAYGGFARGSIAPGTPQAASGS